MTSNDEPSTCGQGVAAHAQVPAKLGELLAALADTLEQHMPALDVADSAARQEHEAYARLMAEHRALAAGLQAAADHMTGCRDLPMGAHDEQAMLAPTVRAAFARYVAVEEQLAAMLGEQIVRDRAMLAQMGAPVSS